jgi:hypothetical protein
MVLKTPTIKLTVGAPDDPVTCWGLAAGWVRLIVITDDLLGSTDPKDIGGNRCSLITAGDVDNDPVSIGAGEAYLRVFCIVSWVKRGHVTVSNLLCVSKGDLHGVRVANRVGNQLTHVIGSTFYGDKCG